MAGKGYAALEYDCTDPSHHLFDRDHPISKNIVGDRRAIGSEKMEQSGIHRARDIAFLFRRVGGRAQHRPDLASGARGAKSLLDRICRDHECVHGLFLPA